MGLLIRPGGSKQRELVASLGGNVCISIHGKGSNSEARGGGGGPTLARGAVACPIGGVCVCNLGTR